MWKKTVSYQVQITSKLPYTNDYNPGCNDFHKRQLRGARLADKSHNSGAGIFRSRLWAGGAGRRGDVARSVARAD
ncbi:hypothetical protein EVAR_20464_1 [Eumeta japonica]|uniref:Uncharacterized protein n=1 Tax=Eumeta variegata TaxID=151549 RepID=A0A4C1TY02_EUMVA|nr:hypothetical protein EVAR_20464_1 [Eumeta japonica]